MSHILTFDLGTTYLKAVVFAPDGSVCAVRRCPTPIVQPTPGHSEMSAEDFESAIAGLASELREAAPEAWGGVKKISFATQTNSFVLLDENDAALTPIVIWNDLRAEGLAVPDYNDPMATGVPEVGASFSPAKLRWIQQHEPDAWHKARRFCLIGDYFTLRFTGRHATEGGAAGLTALLDIHQLAWREAAMERLGLSSLTFPEVLRAGAALGTITPATAEAMSLDPSCEFFMGCLDQYAGAVAAGLLDHGGVSETTGTVLATVTASDRFDPALIERGIFQGPTAKPGWYYRMVFGDTSANLMAAFQKRQPDSPSHETLDAEAAAALIAAQDDPAHQRGREVLAIYQAVADALAEQVRQLRPDDPPKQVYSLGGAAKSACWRGLKSDVLNADVVGLPFEEPTSYGAALLAGLR